MFLHESVRKRCRLWNIGTRRTNCMYAVLTSTFNLRICDLFVTFTSAFFCSLGYLRI